MREEPPAREALLFLAPSAPNYALATGPWSLATSPPPSSPARWPPRPRCRWRVPRARSGRRRRASPSRGASPRRRLLEEARVEQHAAAQVELLGVHQVDQPGERHAERLGRLVQEGGHLRVAGLHRAQELGPGHPGALHQGAAARDLAQREDLPAEGERHVPELARHAGAAGADPAVHHVGHPDVGADHRQHHVPLARDAGHLREQRGVGVVEEDGLRPLPLQVVGGEAVQPGDRVALDDGLPADQGADRAARVARLLGERVDRLAPDADQVLLPEVRAARIRARLVARGGADQGEELRPAEVETDVDRGGFVRVLFRHVLMILPSSPLRKGKQVASRQAPGTSADNRAVGA